MLLLVFAVVFFQLAVSWRSHKATPVYLLQTHHLLAWRGGCVCVCICVCSWAWSTVNKHLCVWRTLKENVLCESPWVHDIKSWMFRNFLQLNTDKTEILTVGLKNQRQRVYSHLASRSLKHNEQVRNLGIILDTDLSFENHIINIARTALYFFKNISNLRAFISQTDS